ncbi:MAG: acyltransferase [Acidobacteriota bacterium]|nr:acyltransferase [Acidobacteriota bacterium]MDE3162511.1 acyltransferase [Acidobacteriota bacterium]
MERIRALDGWRGIAILLVLLDHYEYAILGNRNSTLWGIGQHGVTIFFALSGYLITTNLLKQNSKLPDFYKRRFVRLMPVAWAYLTFVAILQLVFRPPASLPRIPAAGPLVLPKLHPGRRRKHGSFLVPFHGRAVLSHLAGRIARRREKKGSLGCRPRRLRLRDLPFLCLAAIQPRRARYRHAS